jgi:hypothetical protein
MVTLWNEPVLIGGVGEADRVAVGISVGVRTLNCLHLGIGPGTRVLQETLLLRSDAVPSLVTAREEQNG